MPVSSMVDYVDSKDGSATDQVGPVPYSVGNPPNGWCRMGLDYWTPTGTYQSKTLYLGPASYASFVAWLGHDPMTPPDIERAPT